MKNSKFLISSLFLLLLYSSCQSGYIMERDKEVQSWLQSSTEENGVLEGVFILEAQKGDTLIAHQIERLFIPASTTKIFSLYTGMKLLPARLPVLKYRFQNDRIELIPTGDPTQLHPYFKDSTALRFLRTAPPIQIHWELFEENAWGPGWAWEDYPYYFSPDRSAFPLFGNTAEFIENNGTLQVTPSVMSQQINRTTERLARRERFSNHFNLPATSLRDTLIVPYITSDSLSHALLSKELGLQLYKAADSLDLSIQDSLALEAPYRVLPGLVSDSLYKYMMAESDNFLAEQIMLMSASTLSDTLSFRRSRDSIIKWHLPFLQDRSRWVDGSGLSRYNLQSPANLVNTLLALNKDFPESRLQNLFPGYSFVQRSNSTWELQSSPLDSAVVFAKSGYVGNNYNLAGYLYTQKGNLLIFALMQNHYLQPTVEIRRRVATLLHQAYLKY